MMTQELKGNELKTYLMHRFNMTEEQAMQTLQKVKK